LDVQVFKVEFWVLVMDNRDGRWNRHERQSLEQHHAGSKGAIRTSKLWRISQDYLGH
jgi:hypothetical protein